jgi:hypothetical protein
MKEQYIENRPQPKILQLTFGEYSRINYLISIAEGFDLSKGTQRTYTLNPRACKYKLQENGDYEARLVMPITSEYLIKYPELFAELEMFDSYIPVDKPIQELVIDITDQQTLNWSLMQFSVAGNTENLTIKISPETQILLTPEIIDSITSLGLDVRLQ